MHIRQATRDDHEAVRELCASIWPNRDAEYLDRVYPSWIEGEHKHTCVAIDNDRLVGIVQGVMLTSQEAWLQGLRVDPESRGAGVATRLLDRVHDWARSTGANVTRIWVYSWNAAGMGIARSQGYTPVTSFRWARPEPTNGTVHDTVSTDTDTAWSIWTESGAREGFGGLSLDRNESWALSTCSRASLDACEPIVVETAAGRAMSPWTRTIERNRTSIAVYGMSAWEDATAAGALFSAIAADAYARSADSTRVPVLESPHRVSDAALARVPFDPEPHFIFQRSLDPA